MTIVTNLGFPRMGAKRELKQALEAFWRGNITSHQLEDTARLLRHRHWKLQRDAGADVVPCNDFSLYDHVLDAAYMVDAIPDRYRALADTDALAGYFAMARGVQNHGMDLPALEMTKWFDTNYHYIVPELHAAQTFKLRTDKPVAEFLEAKSQGIRARPVLLGPVSLLLLSRTVDGSDRLALLDRLLPVYAELLAKLKQAGADWVQIDEPCLLLDLDQEDHAAYRKAYAALAHSPRPKLLLATYFGALDANLSLSNELPVEGIHIDLVRALEQLDAVLDTFPAQRTLSLGIIDGRNIWRTDMDRVLPLIKRAHAQVGGERLQLAPSCSLLHIPIDVTLETDLSPDVRNGLSFARQKVEELRILSDALKSASALASLENTRQRHRSRHHPVHGHNSVDTASLTQRASPYSIRRHIQQQRLGLPLFPTTTIGSFPQTKEVREARAKYKSGRLSASEYRAFLEQETQQCVQIQEAIGLDVLVHGEFERNDMVEYFAEQLEGFAFTKHGWVQSYGSRCVKPPIIHSDVQRPKPMTVSWSAYAQSLTSRPMKGMLTGPVTMLQWSFVRDDQPRSVTCRQIALALREEVLDLEAAGIRIIQIDEPALREGLPLRRKDWPAYLDWAVESFRITASGVDDSTQIHTHMCYSEFNDIIEAVASMDADVISIETSRSRMELLDAFVKFDYPNAMGPGVYDIHSPRVPDTGEMVSLLERASLVLEPEQLWVNPDCGLKTRGWSETQAALQALVEAARVMRERLVTTVC